MKTPLVLLSGLLSNQCLWQHQVHHLSDIASVQVISPSQNTPQQMVQAILEAAPPTFALAGHSMGGWLCLEIMRAAPARVSHLCLLNTTARMDTEEKMHKRQQMILQAQQGQFQTIVDMLVEKFVVNRLVKKDVERMFLEVGQDAFIRQQEAMIQKQECLSVLSGIPCPTLVIHAMQDKNFSLEEHQELVDQIKGAKLAMVEDSGHMSPMEMPQAVTSLLRLWLTCF